MTNNYSLEDLLDFLSHTGKKGMMPAATSTALAVATRNVFGVLDPEEQENIGGLRLEDVIKRFNNKRARDFNSGSLKEYARRVQRAVELYEQWKDNPADFSVKTRSTGNRRKQTQASPNKIGQDKLVVQSVESTHSQPLPNRQGTYQSSIPVGVGRVITISNIPEDLTSSEADKLAQFVRILAVDQQ